MYPCSCPVGAPVSPVQAGVARRIWLTSSLPEKRAMTVAIIEDQAMFLGLLRAVCEKELGLSVVVGVGTGAEGIELCRRCHPDLVLLDLGLPDGHGLDMVPQFRAASPNSKLLAVSALIDELTALRILDAGLAGFVDKIGTTVPKLAEAVLSVLTGEGYFAPIMREMRRHALADPKSWVRLLTARELEVLRLIGAGLSDEQAGLTLGLSPKTVDSHRQQIMSKLGLHHERDLIRFAVQKGLAKIDPA